jgi:DNA replication and repair protein RecF
MLKKRARFSIVKIMITRLTLTDFRNHETFRVETGGKNVVLTGPNGAGKTNVLEAASLLNGGAGLRGAHSADLARFGAAGYAVAADISDGGGISVFWRGGSGRRAARLDGENAALSELSGRIAIVWLTPCEDLLFIGPPAARRSFLDNLAAGFDGAHIGRVSDLARLVSERAFALKNNRDDGWLALIENNMSALAVAVADARVRFVSELNHFLENGEIGLSGLLERKIMDGGKAGDFEDFYRNYLSENRFLVSDKQTIDGPHRSDFSVQNTLLGLPAAKTSSGQQKLILNGIAIANARLLSVKNPAKPLLILLDEADSHLDAAARMELFDALSKTKAQVWMTGTDAAAFSGMPDCEYVTMG